MQDIKEIEIFSTDFQGKNLAIEGNHVFYCNDIVKEVILLSKNNNSVDEITNEINNKYLTNYKPTNIEESLLLIDKYKEKKKITFPHIDLFFPRGRLFPKIDFTTKHKTFIIIALMFFVNLIYVINADFPAIHTVREKTLIFFLLIIILLGHELGHAFFARQYNIITGKIGIGLYFLIFPVLYITINQIWRLKKGKRIVINCGGIIFQTIIGVLLIICNLFYNNEIISSLIKANFIVICLNLNPLIKFDGYWILSDFWDDRELYDNSKLVIKNWLKLKFKSNMKNKVLIYSFLRLLFILFVLYYFIKFFINIILWLA